ncbi:MAG: hypothetical protein ND895_17960 [Pyrinomonadaceae bacterium]|nr:hypothetical protein [Pyrinomonadaceae bacterium]
MNVKAGNERQAVEYLLGELTEVEQARLEERFFHDPELSELLSEAEDDLIDQYVREELSGPERERFERHSLISERRREKVEFARALLQAEKATAAEGVYSQKPLSWWQAMLSALRAPRPALSYSLAAAALLFLLGGLWLFSEIRQLRREVAQMEADRQTRERQNDQLRDQTIEQRLRSDELAAQREKLEQELALLKEQAKLPDSEKRSALTPLAFILSPSSRGSEGPKKLILPSTAQAVRLQLNLNSGDDYRAYQIRLQTSSGKQIRSWNQLKASSARDVRAVFITVPAELLSSGVQYELTLSGVAGPNRLDDLGYYYFNLQKN